MVVGEAINLEYKMKQGETLRYKTTVQSQQTLQEGSQSATGSSLMEMGDDAESHPTSARKGTMGVDVTIETVNLKRDGEAVQFDQGQDPTGKTVSMKMKKNGEVVQTSMDLPFSQPPFPLPPHQEGRDLDR